MPAGPKQRGAGPERREPARRALAGELSVLEWAWRREQNLAAIADRLGLDEALTDQLAGLGERAV